jgi:hypothetical protein
MGVLDENGNLLPSLEQLSLFDQNIREKWDGTRIVMIDRSYPEAIKRERERFARASLPKAERRLLRTLAKHGL